MALYLLCFNHMENSITSYNIIYIPLDVYIPFCEYFVIPYILWFPYIFFVTAYLCLAGRPAFTKLATFLVIGMTVFLVISFVYPNGHTPGPSGFSRDNIFIDLVKQI